MQGERTAVPRRVRKATGVYRSVSGTYEIQFRDSDGKLRFKTVEGGFEDAKAARRKILEQMDKGQAVRPSKQTFAEFAGIWITDLNKRPRTIEAYRYALNRHLLPRFGRRKLAEISTNDAARLVAE